MRHLAEGVVVSLLAAFLTGPAAAACSGTVYLTFDTGNMAQAEPIAAILAEERVLATFFVAQERTMRGDRALEATWGVYWRARVAEGHAFGNHTWSHHVYRADLPGGRVRAQDGEGKTVELDERGFCQELRRVDDAFQSLTGRRLSGMWRAPAGRTTAQTVRWAATCGFPIHVGWSASGSLGDELPSDRFPNSRLLDRALGLVAPHDVLLMHLGVWDRKEPLAGILPPLIRGLKLRGLCFAPLGGPGASP